MINPRLFFVYLVFGVSFLFGQPDSNSVTVTAIHNVNAQPDQVAIGITVNSGLDASLDSIVGALQGSGVTVADFSGVDVVRYYPTTPDQPIMPMLAWLFNTGVPLARLKDTLTTLSAVQQSIAKKNAGLTMSFSVNGMRFSPALLQSLSCQISDVIADARAQAQKLAGAAGMSVGSVLGISGATSDGGANGVLVGTGVLSSVSGPPTCSATVKFALVRF